MSYFTDPDAEAIVAETLAPFLGHPMTEELNDQIATALRAAGVALDPIDPVVFDVTNGDVVVRLADGREVRWGDMGSRAGVEDRGWGEASRDPFPDDTYDPDEG